jgi:penicillin-binding protein 2
VDVELYDHKYQCCKERNHGRVSLQEVIKQSFDIYFYEVVRLLGINRLQEIVIKFGLGKKVFDNFIEVEKPLILSASWKTKSLRQTLVFKRNYNHWNWLWLYEIN